MRFEMSRQRLKTWSLSWSGPFEAEEGCQGSAAGFLIVRLVRRLSSSLAFEAVLEIQLIVSVDGMTTWLACGVILLVVKMGSRDLASPMAAVVGTERS